VSGDLIIGRSSVRSQPGPSENACAPDANQADADSGGIGNPCDATPSPSAFTTPLVTKVKLKPARFKRHRGTKLTLILSEPATLKITIKCAGKVRKRYTQTGNRSRAKTLSFRIKRAASLRAPRSAT
jgi:hypothetical protein